VQLAVKELRDLANGLHPIALSDGGLAGGFVDLAARTPIAMTVDAPSDRYRPEIEEAAWFIACEAVANTVKHAGASRLAITARYEQGCLRVSIEDDGRGGADPQGRGLRGIMDRAEAAGGHLSIRSPKNGGTLVLVELPCES
jgi:signal transduction histidine kinase